MPSRRVKDSERRRCPRACSTCKRRKERCDGVQPCRRCKERGLANECRFQSHPSPLKVKSTRGVLPSTYPRVGLALQSPESDSESEPEPEMDMDVEREAHPVVTTEQNAQNDCQQQQQQQQQQQRHCTHDELLCSHHRHLSRDALKHDRVSGSGAGSCSGSSAGFGFGSGSLSFIGDASNLCFIQGIRHIVEQHFGRCSFVDDPLRLCMVETQPEGSRSSRSSSSTRGGGILRHLAKGTLNEAHSAVPRSPPSKVTADEVDYFVTWFDRATHCTVSIFDRDALHKEMSTWQHDLDACSEPQLAVFHLVIAIGAQAGPDDHDDLAEEHFTFGRYITLMTLMDEPSIATIQCHTLIATYLLVGSRRNAAFMYLGIAVRGAYALGIHRKDVSRLFDSLEYRTRERLWRALRILDLFMSAVLGRPPATMETRDTTAVDDDDDDDNGYSALNDICWIFEYILTNIYSKRLISKESFERVSQLHRDWSLRFERGMQTDGICPGEPFYPGNDKALNIGLLHLKEAYYWTINLITRPFLLQYVSSVLAHGKATAGSHNAQPPDHLQGHLVVVQACIDSAFRTAELLYPLVSETLVPKRLPFAMNSAFISALVLSVALLADLEDSATLSHSFQQCRAILLKFSKHDTVTRRYLVIIDYLQEVCDFAILARRRERMESVSQSIWQIFGNLPDSKATTATTANTTSTTNTTTTAGFTGFRQVEEPLSATVDIASSSSGSAPSKQGNTATPSRRPPPAAVSPGPIAEYPQDNGHAPLPEQTYTNGALGTYCYTPTNTSGRRSPFALGGIMPNFGLHQTQQLDLPSSTPLFLGPSDEGMLFPTVDATLMDFGVLEDWGKG